jgi:hypothetical protein
MGPAGAQTAVRARAVLPNFIGKTLMSACTMAACLTHFPVGFHIVELVLSITIEAVFTFLL